MAETISMPKLGFDMQEGTLVRWVRTEGESIKKGEVLAEIETDKATVEVESSASGVIRKLLVDQGAIVPIGAPIAIVGTADEKIDAPAAPVVSKPPAAEPTGAQPIASATAMPGAPQAQPPQVTGATKASPLARRMARDAKVDLAKLHGSGPGGRITRKDVEAALGGGGAMATASGTGITLRHAEVVSREDSKVPLSKLRQAIARRMSESKSSVPHFYVTHEYKMERLMDLREQANSVLPNEGKLSVNDFLVKSVALCLREFPNLNSAFQGDHVLRRGNINIGVAVAVEGGLLTIVCRNADQKGLLEISNELRAMAGRARSGKVHPADIEGSTFTISNLGMFDVENFGAIINPPEAAILALGSARQVPVVEDGTVRPGWRMKATLAVDHRASDGAEAAQFMQALAKYVETPISAVLS
ncbi:MAG TPA: dihydrolipoamide acetyltransferase family protein [Anaerolineales bacterium]|nr:dihydrolipoamide acetyltransferase family protein [Anaerolineales bacterium]